MLNSSHLKRFPWTLIQGIGTFVICAGTIASLATIAIAADEFSPLNGDDSGIDQTNSGDTTVGSAIANPVPDIPILEAPPEVPDIDNSVSDIPIAEDPTEVPDVGEATGNPVPAPTSSNTQAIPEPATLLGLATVLGYCALTTRKKR